jgi:hypothetical protein
VYLFSLPWENPTTDLEADVDEPERSHGWTLFATIVVGVAGAWNLILGIAALTKKEYFHPASLLYQNLAFWGVVWLVIGSLQILTAFLVSRRTTVGKALGLIGASVSLLVWFFSLGAHPMASILVILMDMLILYALTADRPYGGVEPYVGRQDAREDLTIDVGRPFR